ncbi:hypothetical protein ES705_29876 [subsurface metagenome]
MLRTNMIINEKQCFMKVKKIVIGIAMMVVFISLSAQKPFRGAEVYSNNSVLYGKFEMDMKMIKGSGMLSTFFTYKNDSYIQGVFWEEIDIEVLGKDDATVLSTNIITDGVSGDPIHDVEEIHFDYSLADDFHTYTLEWTPDSVVWYIDGVVVRRETDAVVSTLTSQQGYRFNAWISCSAEWAGELDPSDLPQYQYVDWIEYHSYNSGDFMLEWRDDFETFDASRWSKANWTFDCNEVDFAEENAYIEDGKLVLAITDPDPSTALFNNMNTSDYLEIINNSSSMEIQVRLFENGHYKFQLFDLQGRIILINEINGERYNIPYADFKSGIYFLNVQSKDNSVTKKIYIE